MPPRWLSAAIVVFWLGMTGWLGWREYWPRWHAGDPPPFHIDLVEEVQRASPRTPWAVLQDGQPTRRAESWVEHRPADDTFALGLEFKKGIGLPRPAGGLLPQVRLTSSLYRVTRDGRLLELEVQAEVHGTLPIYRAPVDGTLVVAGDVRGRRFYPRCRLDGAVGTLLDVNLAPVEVSYHGSVLVPQHPVNKITGLRPGQSWRMPAVEPLAAALGLTDAVRHVNARVRPGPQVLQWGSRKPKTCLVIDYEGEDELGSTWVEVGTDLVQRQETAFAGKRFVLQRDD